MSCNLTEKFIRICVVIVAAVTVALVGFLLYVSVEEGGYYWTGTLFTKAASFAAACLFSAAVIAGAKNIYKDFSFPQWRRVSCESIKNTRVRAAKVFFIVLGYSAFLLIFIQILGILLGKTGTQAEIFEKIWTKLDSQHYLYVAENGYTAEGDYGKVVEIVFFPGYPLLIRGAAAFSGNYLLAATGLSVLFFAGAAAIIYLLTEELGGERAASNAVAVLCLLPGSFFFVAPMTESLFLFTTVGCVYLAKHKRWLGAALLGAYASFTRSAGVFVAVIFVYEVVKDFVSDTRITPKNRKKFAMRAVFRCFYVLLIFAGLGTYLIINKVLYGDWFKFLYYQRVQWSQQSSLFLNTPAYVTDRLIACFSGNGQVTTGWGLWLPELLAIMLTCGNLAVNGRKLRGDLSLYSLIYFVFSVGVSWLLSGVRYMLALFTQPIMIGQVLAKKNIFVKISVYIIMAVLNVIYIIMFLKRWQVW